jgi:hypothetical protein
MLSFTLMSVDLLKHFTCKEVSLTQRHLPNASLYRKSLVVGGDNSELYLAVCGGGIVRDEHVCLVQRFGLNHTESALLQMCNTLRILSVVS